ncbi:MAG: hypothetical protein K2J79_05120 [Ruminiclostridium sp.]|nr:hypothetical protein [Ruminiclostridium sp.]
MKNYRFTNKKSLTQTYGQRYLAFSAFPPANFRPHFTRDEYGDRTLRRSL